MKPIKAIWRNNNGYKYKRTQQERLAKEQRHQRNKVDRCRRYSCCTVRKLVHDSPCRKYRRCAHTRQGITKLNVRGLSPEDTVYSGSRGYVQQGNRRAAGTFGIDRGKPHVCRPQAASGHPCRCLDVTFSSRPG